MPGNCALLLPDAPRFTIVAVTDDYVKVSGKKREELVDTGLFEAFPNSPDDPDQASVKRLKESLEEVLLKKRSSTLPLHRYDIPTGVGKFDERYWSAINKPIIGDGGEIKYILHSAEDVTLKIRSDQGEKRIKSLEQSYDVFMQAPVTIGIVKGKDYIIELANENLLEVWGRSNEVIGKPLFEAITELQGQGFKELLDEVQRTGEPFLAFEHPILLIRNGKEETIYFDFIYKAYYENGNSEPSGVIAVGHDVTEKVLVRQEQVKMEEKVRRNEQRYRNLFQNSPVAKWDEDFTGVKEKVAQLVDKGITDFQKYFSENPKELYNIIDTIIVNDVNEAALELWGGSKEELLKGLNQFFSDDTLQTIIEEINIIAAGGGRFENETTVQNIHGEKINVLVRIDFPFTDDYSSIPVILVNITERKKAEESLRESENRFRTLAEALPQMVWMRDVKGNIEYGSRSWEEYSGIKGVSEAWRYMVHPEDWQTVMDSWKRDAEKSQPYRYEVRLRNKEGEYRWHYASGEPVRNKDGVVIKWIGALTDIHAQKTFAENLEKEVEARTQDLRNSERKLEQTVKELERSNEDLQQFAHVASHDLKEPVRKVLTFGHRLKDELGKNMSERALGYFSKIESASLRMYSMIDGVLLYSSMNALEQTREVIDLNETIQNIEEDLEVGIAQKEATLHYNNLPSIEGSPILVYQLFYNLVGNSLKFAKAGEKLTIEVLSKPLSEEEVRAFEINEPRNFVKISIKDNGIGFNQANADKIFQTFMRLNAKDKYEGTGLGLSLSRKIVERHGGMIYAEGREGEGATFHVILPVEQ